MTSTTSIPLQPQSHAQQAAFRGGSRTGPIPASRPSAASSLLDRTSHSFCRSPRQPHCAPVLHSAWAVQQVITEKCRILELVQLELCTPTPAAWIQVLEKRLSLWCQQCQQHGPQIPRSLLGSDPSGVLARGAQIIADVCVQNEPFSLDARPSCTGALRGSSRARSGSVFRLLEHAWCDAAVARFVSSGACFLTLSPIFFF